jgi:hypothetical protein
MSSQPPTDATKESPIDEDPVVVDKPNASAEKEYLELIKDDDGVVIGHRVLFIKPGDTEPPSEETQPSDGEPPMEDDDMPPLGESEDVVEAEPLGKPPSTEKSPQEILAENEKNHKLALLADGEKAVKLLFNDLVVHGDVRLLARGQESFSTAMLLAKAALPSSIPPATEKFIAKINELQDLLKSMQGIAESNLFLLANATEELIQCKLWVISAVEKGPGYHHLHYTRYTMTAYPNTPFVEEAGEDEEEKAL